MTLPPEAESPFLQEKDINKVLFWQGSALQ